jgi:hypothetical protein
MSKHLIPLLLAFCGVGVQAQTASIMKGDGSGTQTTDGGRTWVQVPRQAIRGEYRDTKGVLRTEDSGRTWTFTPSQNWRVDCSLEGIARSTVLSSGVLHCTLLIDASCRDFVTDLRGRLHGDLQNSGSIQADERILFLTVVSADRPASTILLSQTC